MFVTESRYGNGFCQPGEILRQPGAERDPAGDAGARGGSADPSAGETEARSRSEASPGSEGENVLNVWEQEPSPPHPSSQ